MLSIKNLNAGYEELHILHDVSLNVKAGEIVALIGPNGAGKSTIIKSIFNIAKVMSGKIIFKEKNITHLKTHELVELGISYVNQGRINFTNLTVEENLTLGAELIQEKEVVEKNKEAIYKKFPILHERRKQLAFGLSGGQQQVLAIARSLMQNPSLLLMDEPSLGLSPKAQTEIFATIKKLRDEGIAIVIVEQNAKKAIELADRTYLLEEGKIVLEGNKSIVKHPKIKSVYLGGA
ncbi:ABC transporter ATP-binding protein [Candidatus Woesearchaeota archaeon]|nr:ABC transporter ATP-binding protein [Candidatus Woesearchaeota archaeon]